MTGRWKPQSWSGEILEMQEHTTMISLVLLSWFKKEFLRQHKKSTHLLDKEFSAVRGENGANFLQMWAPMEVLMLL